MRALVLAFAFALGLWWWFRRSSGGALSVVSDSEADWFLFPGGDNWFSLAPAVGAPVPGGVSSPSSLSALIDKYANLYGVDPAIAQAMARKESGGKQSAVSSKGALGVFQIMPATAAELGGNPRNLEDNIRMGMQYLSDQLRAFGGDYRLALAAYNAGPGAVHKYGGVPPYKETQDYVSKILSWASVPGGVNG